METPLTHPSFLKQETRQEIKSPAVCKVPRHVGIIMDGNGRWAVQKGLKRGRGHLEGAKRVKAIIRESDNLGIEVLSLFCFSTENWNRPMHEVSFLMELLVKFLRKEGQKILDNNIKVNSFGQTERIPAYIKNELDRLAEASKNNTGLVLNFCISYGGRMDLIQATQKIAQLAVDGKIKPEDISEKLITSHLYTGNLPDPDLIIRTSGEYRMSNFLLWQSAYSEIYVTETHWPDFYPENLQEACLQYTLRKRRFGHTKTEASSELTH